MKLIKKAIHTIFVTIISFLVGTVLRFYFKRWQVANYENIPHKGPVIYASNHQNAFLDPLVIYFSQARITYFLVRANIFKNPTARFWLEALYMLPIYRVRDGLRSVAKNDEVIENCANILTDGKHPLIIFSEGNHNMRRALRPLQKGIARIAFAAMEANNFELDLAIVPTGLNYGRHTRFRSDMLCNFGKPIYLKKYTELYKENPNKAYQQLVADIFEELDKEVLSIRPSVAYKHIEHEWLSMRASDKDMIAQFANDKALISSISKKYREATEESLKEAAPEPKPPLPSLIYRILMFPVFLYGFINSFIGYKILDVIIKKVVSDIHFYGSIKSAINIVLAPLIFSLQAYLVYLFTNNGLIAGLYLVSLPFATILAFDYKFAVFDRLPRMKGVANYKI